MSNISIDILHIEDNPGDALLFQELIHEFDVNHNITVDLARDLDSGFDKLAKDSYDLIFSDLGLPGIGGLDAVKLILEKHPDNCIVVLSGNQNLEMAKQALHLGAQDFLMKNDLKSIHIEKAITFAMERFAMKKQLQAQKKELFQLTTAVEQSSNVIVVTDTKGRIEYVNEKFCEVTGYTKEEAKGQNPSILSSGEQPKEFYEDLWNTIKAGKAWKGEFLNKKRDGSLFWERATITPTFTADGEIANYLAIKEDITESRLVADKLSFATQVAELGTWQWDTRTGQFEINQVLRDRLKLKNGESLQHISEYHQRIHPDDFEKAYKNLEEHLSGKRELYEAVYRLISNDQEALWVYDSGQITQRDPQGNFIVMNGVSLDITTIKKQELELQFEQDQLLATQKLGKIGSWFYNLEKESFDYVSPANHQIMGWEEGQKFSRSLLLEKVYQEDRKRFDEKLDQMVEGHEVTFNFRIEKNDHIHWIKLISTPTVSATGKKEGVLVLVQDITEEYEQQNRIEANERKFRTIFENATVGIVYQDEQGQIIEANKMASEVLGIDHQDLKQQSVHDDDWLFVNENLEEIAAGQMPSEQVLKNKKPVSNFLMGIENQSNKEIRWINIDSFPLRDPVSKQLTTCTIFNDVTEEKQYQEKIESNERRLKSAQKIASFAHWTYNYQSQKFEWSDALFELFQMDSSIEPSRKVFLERLHPDDRSRVKALLKKSWTDFNITQMKYRMLFPNGEVKYFEDSWDTQFDQNGQPLLTLGVSHDITDLKQAEVQTAEARNKLLSILVSIDDIVMMLDNDLVCTEVFPGGGQDLIVPAEEFLGKKISKYIPKHLASELAAKVEILNETQQTQKLEYSLNNRDKENWYNAHISIVRGADDQPLGYTLIIRDITESHRFNQYLNSSLELYEAYNQPKAEFVQVGIDLGEKLLQSRCAFFHEVDEEANKIKLIDWSSSTKQVCTIPNLVADYDIDEAGIWVDCVASRKAEIHNDYPKEKHKKGLLSGHFPIERDLQVPIIVDGKVVAIYGVGNKPEDYNQLDAELLSNYAQLFYSLVERKELEEEYLETLETFEESQKIGQIGAFKIDYVYRSIWASDKLYEIYGIESKEGSINFDNWLDFTHPVDREEHNQKHKQAFKLGTFEYEYRIKLDSGEVKYLYVKSQIEKDQDGKPVKELGLVQDVTSLKKAQISYEERTQQFENIVSSIQGIVYRVKFPSNQVEFVSPYIEQMLGYTVEEIKNDNAVIKKIVHTDDFENTMKDVEQSLKKEKDFNVMFRLVNKEEKTLWVNATGVLAEIEGGEFVIEGLIVDITERVRSEERVMNAFMEASDAERQRISKEIHDSLQQTLTIASLNLEFVKMEKDKLSQKIQDKFDLGYDYLKKSLNDSRSIAHSLMPKAIEDFGFVSVVESMIDDLNKASKANFEFITNISELRFKVPIDTSLYKITQEATNNIMKHAQAENVTVQYMKLGDTIQLTIEDDGNGFDVSDLTEKFSGFGLASIRNRASSIGAEIFIDSCPGHGTTIILEFPFAEHLLFMYEQD